MFDVSDDDDDDVADDDDGGGGNDDDGNDDDSSDDDDGPSGPGGGGGGPNITATPNLIDSGTETDVFWKTGGDTNCVLTSSHNDPNFNGTPVDADGNGDSVEIFGEVTYTITCDNGSDSAVVRVREHIEDF